MSHELLSVTCIVTCDLCDQVGGTLLWQEDLCRVVLVDDPHYPGFCRVILNRHVKEMTDLEESERSRLMAVVFAVESAVRAVLQPDKINLASLGNMTPHVHWHVIPRYTDDRHFPNAIWGESLRTSMKQIPDTARLQQAISHNIDALS